MASKVTVPTLMCLMVWGCSTTTPATSPDAGSSSPPSDSGATPPIDAGVSADAEPPTDSGVVPGECERLGHPTQAFLQEGAGLTFGDIAGDFTVNTTDGQWRLQDNWTGCDSFVFLNYIPTNGNFEDRLWRSNPRIFVDSTDPNAHFFFLSWEQTERERTARAWDIKDQLDSYIDSEWGSEEIRNQQKSRFHYVIDNPLDINGSVGAFLTDYLQYQQDPSNRVDLGDRGMAPPPLPFVFAIDREQKWDSGGSLNEFVGGDPSFRMSSFLPAFFDHKAALRDRLASESGVVKIPLLEERVEERVFVVDGLLPSAAEMTNYDTLEVDVSVFCPARNVFGCSEWDRIARISVCLDAMCDERRELVRWITPYWRRGERRWIMDASSLMGLVADGGMQKFRIEMGPGWERKTPRDANVQLRLSNTGKADRAVGAMRAFTGGNFNADYNMREPFAFTPPTTAKRVELVLILSGHGQAMMSNCAEWCDHRHQFAVNGTDIDEIRHIGMIGSIEGCGGASGQGVPPGQFGNWAPERAYWCPGLPVDHKRIDITDQVTVGQENRLNYSANYRGGDPGGGNISLNAYVVWYE